MGNFYSKFRDKGGEETKKDEICNSSSVARQQSKYSDDGKQNYSSGFNDKYAGVKPSHNKQYASFYDEVSRTEMDSTNADIHHGVSFDTERNNRCTDKTEIIETEMIIKPEIEINSRERKEQVNQHKEEEIIIEEDTGIIVDDDVEDKRNDAKQPAIILDEDVPDVSEQEFGIDLDQVLNRAVQRSRQITFDKDIANSTDETAIIIDDDADSVRLSPTIAFDIDVAGLIAKGAQTAINEETEITVEQRFPLVFDINEIPSLNSEKAALGHDTEEDSAIEQVHQSIPGEDVIHVTDEEPEIVIEEDPYNAIRNDSTIILEDESDRIRNEFEVTDSVVEPLTLRIDEEGALSVVLSKPTGTETNVNEIGYVPEMPNHNVSNASDVTESNSDMRQTNINTDSAKNCRITLDSLEVRLSLTPESHDSPSVDNNAKYDSSRYYTTIQNNNQDSGPDVHENNNFLQAPETLEPNSRKRKMSVPDTLDYTTNTGDFEENIGYGESEAREGSKKKKHRHKHKHKHKHRDKESITS